jgi:hypothetical protein
MILTEYRFTFLAGPNSQVFRIEEFRGRAGWPGRYRIKIPATSEREARTFYGRTCFEVSERVTLFLTDIFEYS